MIASIKMEHQLAQAAFLLAFFFHSLANQMEGAFLQHFGQIQHSEPKMLGRQIIYCVSKLHTINSLRLKTRLCFFGVLDPIPPECISIGPTLLVVANIYILAARKL